jgi:hypothetical protein
MAEILLSPGTLAGFAFVFGKREKSQVRDTAVLRFL